MASARPEGLSQLGLLLALAPQELGAPVPGLASLLRRAASSLPGGARRLPPSALTYREARSPGCRPAAAALAITCRACASPPECGCASYLCSSFSSSRGARWSWSPLGRPVHPGIACLSLPQALGCSSWCLAARCGAEFGASSRLSRAGQTWTWLRSKSPSTPPSS